MDIDQMTIECPICGKRFPYNRWSSKPQAFICSKECELSYYAKIGGAKAEDLLSVRAADPNRCIMCGRFMEDKIRHDKLLCSYRCQKRAQRQRINVDELREIRLSAIGKHRKSRSKASEEKAAF